MSNWLDENPYRSPVSRPPMANRQEDLRAIAAYQRATILCLVGSVSALGIARSVPLAATLAVVGFMAAISAVFVFLLSLKAYRAWAGALALGLLAALPLIGLFILLVVNKEAVRILKRNGYEVGLLGAEPPAPPPDR